MHTSDFCVLVFFGSVLRSVLSGLLAIKLCCFILKFVNHEILVNDLQI